MGRQCLFSGCRTMLSEHVPNHIRLCGIHQFEVKKLADLLRAWDLKEEDYIFLACHEEGANAKEFAQYLQVSETTILSRLGKKQIKGSHLPDCKNFHKIWQISQKEMARVIDIIRNLISIPEAAKFAKVSAMTLHKYVRAGHFGSTGKSFSGDLAIRRTELVTIEEKCQQLRAAYQIKRKAPRKYTSAKEYKVCQLTRLIGAGRNTVYQWLTSGHLPARRLNKKWIISNEDIKVFIQKAERAEIAVKPLLLDHLRSLVQ